MQYLFLQNNAFERLEATEVEMEQPYWVGFHDSLTDDIQFVMNHARLIESIEGSLQRPAKNKRRFSRILNTQMWIPILQSHSSTPPPPPPSHRPSPPTAASTLVFDSPPRSSLLPPPAVVGDSQYESSKLWMSYSLSHRTLAAHENFMLSFQVFPSIQVILITSTYQLNLKILY